MALDEKGITLAEVSHKYPRVFQSLGYDVLMDTDAVGKPKVISSFELCINSILTLLLMKPGQYPSIPELGIDVEQYLHEYSDDDQITQNIQSALDDQCNRIQITGITTNVYIDKTSDNTDALIIEITGNDRISYGATSNRVIIGISYDKLDRLYIRRSYV